MCGKRVGLSGPFFMWIALHFYLGAHFDLMLCFELLLYSESGGLYVIF
jgi:hypothetical protein